MACAAGVVWDEGYLTYDFGEHPMNPLRLDLTMRLARGLGVLDRVTLVRPEPAADEQLRLAHSQDYLDAVRAAGSDLTFTGYGLGTDDDPVFAGIFEASALIAGGSRVAAQLISSGRFEHAVNIAGGLHHAMREAASGFCVFNDVVVAIRTLQAAGVGRIAYVDIDVHHGDGVQAAFWDDPDVLTVSIHQDPRTLFPGTGMPDEVGGDGATGAAVNLALPPGTKDGGWLRGFRAVVPGALRAFKPEVLVTQCGCDTHHEDPLANLELTVDGQRAAIEQLHRLAHEICGGKWLAVGGGGYGIVRCVPRTWTNLIATASGVPVDPWTSIPDSWKAHLRELGARGDLPAHMGERELAEVQPWMPGGSSWLDRAIGATRHAAYPLLGLDPDDPRD